MENRFMCDLFPSKPKIVDSSKYPFEQYSHKWGAKSSQIGKASNNCEKQESPKPPVPLPPKVKEFIAEPSVHYRGDKLAEIEENDMVCKLVYGHLNRVVQVNKKDFQFLKPGVYLNDILILFHLRFLQHYVIPKPLESSVHIFDPQFFTKLQEQPKNNNNNNQQQQQAQQDRSCLNGEDRYAVSHGYKGVKRWTKKCDIFSKEYILVPIC